MVYPANIPLEKPGMGNRGTPCEVLTGWRSGLGLQIGWLRFPGSSRAHKGFEACMPRFCFVDGSMEVKLPAGPESSLILGDEPW